VRLPAPLHDIVAHSLGVLVFQAGVGEQLIDRDPGQAREAFRAIRAAGLEAVGEMGTILGLIRGDGVTGGNPSPGPTTSKRWCQDLLDARPPGLRLIIPLPILCLTVIVRLDLGLMLRFCSHDLHGMRGAARPRGHTGDWGPADER
jgi:Histidine kinase